MKAANDENVQILFSCSIWSEFCLRKEEKKRCNVCTTKQHICCCCIRIRKNKKIAIFHSKSNSSEIRERERKGAREEMGMKSMCRCFYSTIFINIFLETSTTSSSSSLSTAIICSFRKFFLLLVPSSMFICVKFVQYNFFIYSKNKFWNRTNIEIPLIFLRICSLSPPSLVLLRKTETHFNCTFVRWRESYEFRKNRSCHHSYRQRVGFLSLARILTCSFVVFFCFSFWHVPAFFLRINFPFRLRLEWDSSFLNNAWMRQEKREKEKTETS